jgi:hypothetical protein
MKKAIWLLLMVGIFLIGSVSQVLAENNKAEGITSETPRSLQSEQSFFSKDNLNLLAADKDKDKDRDKDRDRDRDKDRDRDRDRDKDRDRDRDKNKDKNKPDCSKFQYKTCISNPHCCWKSSNSQTGHCVNCNCR